MTCYIHKVPRFWLILVLSFGAAETASANFTATGVDDFPGATTGVNCTGTPNKVAPPGWEWNYDPGSGPGCVDSKQVASPSQDGQARDLEISWKCPSGNTCPTQYGGVIAHASINSAANGNLDETDSSFSYSIWVYYTDLSHIDQLEFDLNQVLSNGDGTTDTIIYAAQCNFARGTWDIGNGWPIHTNVACDKATSPLAKLNAWHHVVLSYHRGPHSKGQSIVTYDAVEIDGVAYPFTGTHTNNDAYTLNWGPSGLLLINWQMDFSFTSAGGATAYADSISVTSPESYSPAGSITGKVTNVSNGAGLAGATVKYGGGSTTSDSSGHYTLSNVSSGTYQVTSSAAGYLSRTFPVTVTAGTATVQDFPLATAGILSGMVTNWNGVGLAGASVSLSGGVVPTTMTLTADASGSYVSGWIPVGSYSVTANLAGRSPQTKTAAISAGATTTLDFHLSKLKSNAAVPGLRDSYAYPNPALPGRDPVIRAFLGLVDDVEVTIFDVSGRTVYNASAGGSPTGISADGDYYYDLPWTGPKASGTYFYVLHANGSSGTVRSRGQLSVIR